jgi:hypothetical protein
MAFVLVIEHCQLDRGTDPSGYALHILVFFAPMTNDY